MWNRILLPTCFVIAFLSSTIMSMGCSDPVCHKDSECEANEVCAILDPADNDPVRSCYAICQRDDQCDRDQACELRAGDSAKHCVDY